MDSKIKEVIEKYFEETEITKEEVIELVTSVMPVLGELEVIEGNEGSLRKLVLIDKNKTIEVKHPDGKSKDLEVDLTTELITIILGHDGTIDIIENNFIVFTPANKETVLAYTSLIGKKLV